MLGRVTTLWPDVPATLFGDDRRFPMQSAHVGYVLDQQDVYAYREGYRRGAMILAERAHASDEPPELLVWPVAWLWRHYLELALKETIATGKQLDDESAEWVWPHGHLLAKLWGEARAHVEPHGDSSAPELVNVGAIVAEFDALDRDGTGFRYQESLAGGRSLPTAPEHINVGLLDETMQRIATFLDAVRSAQRAGLQHLRDQASFRRE